MWALKRTLKVMSRRCRRMSFVSIGRRNGEVAHHDNELSRDHALFLPQ
jgi:hypothetical protein